MNASTAGTTIRYVMAVLANGAMPLETARQRLDERGGARQSRRAVRGAPDSKPDENPHAGALADQRDCAAGESEEQEDRPDRDVGELAAEQRCDLVGHGKC